MRAAARANRKQIFLIERFRTMRHKAQRSLDKNHHYAIFVRMSRATIGEIYNHARNSEALLTLRYLDPIILPTEVLLNRVTTARAARISTDELYAELKLDARAWAKKREPVRHPKWRDKKISKEAP
jgi:hypothetical protein